MTATNHVIAGALIATVIKQPLLALPIAFASHFVMDALPHFGWDGITTGKFKAILFTDMAVASLVLLAIFFSQTTDWFWIMAAGIAAASPDLMWYRYWVADLKGKPLKKGKVARFHGRIQWAEFPKGMIIEIVWFFVFGSILLSRI